MLRVSVEKLDERNRSLRVSSAPNIVDRESSKTYTLDELLSIFADDTSREFNFTETTENVERLESTHGETYTREKERATHINLYIC